MIPVTCTCGQSFAAEPHLAGKRVRCPACKNPLRIPVPEEMPLELAPLDTVKSAPAKTPSAPTKASGAARPAPSPTKPAAAPVAPAGGKPIVVACPCGRRFQAESRLAGKRVRCTACGATLQIPLASSNASNGVKPQAPATAAKPKPAAPAAQSAAPKQAAAPKPAAARPQAAAKPNPAPQAASASKPAPAAQPAAKAAPSPRQAASAKPAAAPQAKSSGGMNWDLLENNGASSAQPVAARASAKPAAPKPEEPLMADLEPLELQPLESEPLDLMSGSTLDNPLDAFSTSSKPLAPVKSKHRSSTNYKPFLIFGGIAAAALLVCGGGITLLVKGVQMASAARPASSYRSSYGSSPSRPPTFPVFGAPAASSNWSTHNGMEDQYTVQMPGFIRQQMKTEFTPAGPVQMRVALCDMGQRGAYFASAARMPISSPGASPDLVLDGAVNGVLATQPGATLKSRQTITLNGHPGRELAFDMKVQGQSASARLRVYYVNDRLYQIMWLGPQSAMSPSEIDKFFSSFTLTGSNGPAGGVMNSVSPASPMQTSSTGRDRKTRFAIHRDIAAFQS